MVKNRKFWEYVSQSTHQWIYLVLTYIGPNNGQGIQAFKDGTPIKNRGEGVGDHTVGDGRVVVGKKYIYINNYYSHVEMDELIFFNKALLEEEVRELHNVYQWQGKMNMIKFGLIDYFPFQEQGNLH